MGSTEPESGVTGRTVSAKSTTLSATNERILRVARDAFTHGQEWESKQEAWEFFCECGRNDCHEYVSLTLDAYVALHDGDRAVLADGHRLRPAEHPVRRSRKNSRELDERRKDPPS